MLFEKKQMKTVDIVIPVLNEAENLPKLIKRLDKSLKKANILYQAIIVDDHSTDKTREVIAKLKEKYPLIYLLKKGKKGKAYSILQGALVSKFEWIAMLDADLQYPPEAIPKMLEKAKEDNTTGIVIGEREISSDISAFRKLISRVSRYINGKLVMNFNYDVQSGLKLFRKEIVRNVRRKDVYPWALDIPLIYEAIELGYSIKSVSIKFHKRLSGKAKIKLTRATLQILWGGIKTRLRPKRIYKISPNFEKGMLGSGFIYKRKKFVTHSTLKGNESALKTFSGWQKMGLFFAFIFFLYFFVIDPKSTAIVFMGLLTLIYFADVLFNLYLIFKSLSFPPEIKFAKKEIDNLKDEDLPIYTILSPLYKEKEVLSDFIESISKLNYPKEKLDLILLLEKDDRETQEEAAKLDLPDFARVLVVPDSEPKTKPKACNFGLNYAKGEYVVIYDAEDRPDPDQLKKSILTFRKLGDKVSCVQAKLNYYNPHQNLLTRLFTAEYSLWFDIVLPALQSIETTIPLGGTSNHFRTKELINFRGWDSFNVTEDADLGVRLFRNGGRTAIINSVTLEEANSNLKNWIRQRSRWIKGYMQTYLVHMRNPIKLFREQKKHFLIFQLISGLRISFMLINPLMWFMTLAYFTLNKFVGPAIESIYPAPIFYMAVFSAVFGNFLYVYYYMIGAAKRKQWEIIKYVFFVPFYWVLSSIAAFMAFWQLFTKPHFWEKTIHGLHIPQDEKKKLKFVFAANLKQFGLSGVRKFGKYASREYLSGALLIGATMIAHLVNFGYNIFLGRELSLEDFGLISLFGSFTYITSLITTTLGKTITHKSAFLYGKYSGPVKQLWYFYRKKLIVVSFVSFILWIIATPLMAGIFKTNQIYPFLVFSPVWIMGILRSVDGGVLAGNLLFGIVSIVTLVEPAVKLLLTVLFVEAGLGRAVYWAIPISIFFGFLSDYLGARSIKGVDKKIDQKLLKQFPTKFFVTSFFTKFSTVMFLSLDLVLAKLFLSPEAAGIYALLSVTGKIIYFLSTLFGQFVVPYSSKESGQGINRKSSFVKLISVIGAVTGVGVIVFGIFSNFSAPFLLGKKAAFVVPYLPLFTTAIALHSMSAVISSFGQAKNKFMFPVVEFLLSLLTLVGFMLFHQNLWQFVWVMLIGGILSLGGVILLYFFYSEVRLVVLAVRGLFSNEQESRGLNILIFNWRDMRHKWSGGAEVYIHEIAKRLVKRGSKVTIFCGSDRKSPRSEVIDGVQIIRRGGFYTVFIWAFLYYIFKFRNKFDLIIDSENGIPFFTPLYSKKKKYLLIHHVHQEVFRVRLKPPLSWIGYYLEKKIMPLVYKNVEVITVSPSSRKEIWKNKLTSKVPNIIYNGVDTRIFHPGKKAKTPTVLYLGRLSPQKSLHIFLKIAKKILSSFPEVQFIIAGDGQEKNKLQNMAKKMGIDKKVSFLGRVDDEQKLKLYQKAWVFVNPSIMEGWGITTIEANACGVPVVASRVSGLQDAVNNPHSGYLVEYGDVDSFTEKITKILKDKKLREELSGGSIAWAKRFTWRKSTDDLLNLFTQ